MCSTFIVAYFSLLCKNFLASFFVKVFEKERGAGRGKTFCKKFFLSPQFSILSNHFYQKIPCSNIAVATFLKPAMFAPATRS